jgi:protein-disulfide isomerase
MGKRQQTKEKQKQFQRIKQLITIISIIIAAALFVGLLIYPSLNPGSDLIIPKASYTLESQDMTLGNPDAPVSVEVFSDFQCPACGFYVTTEEANFINEFVSTDQVYYIFRPFNFIGPESDWAAEAAYCAVEQGNFWEFHDMVYYNLAGENTGAVDDERLTSYAKSIGLNTKDFSACLASDKYVDQINIDNEYAMKSGITGTPSFKVGEKVVSYGSLRDTVLEALAQ